MVLGVESQLIAQFLGCECVQDLHWNDKPFGIHCRSLEAKRHKKDAIQKKQRDQKTVLRKHAIFLFNNKDHAVLAKSLKKIIDLILNYKLFF